ncbi:MAG: phytanoyl-CoA dioxygenase family protein [bacterium]
MSNSSEACLTEGQVQSFIADGYVRIDGAFPAEIAGACRGQLWAAIGLSPDNPAGWTQPVVRVAAMATPPFVAAGNTAVLHAAYDRLVGAGRWQRPQGLGTFPIRFPSPVAPGDDGWHIDASFGTEAPDFMDWRVNVVSQGRALLMLFLLSDVGPEDAPTRIRVGSHLTIAQELLPHGMAGTTLRELSAGGFASTGGCREVQAVGAAGTVYLCHPFLVHAAQAHRGTAPRFMAQPPLLPVGAFDPALPPSPVQVAIRRACGLEI